MSDLKLDAATSAKLTELDPSLAALPRAVQACSRQSTWRLHDVRWTPGEGCRLAYAYDHKGSNEFFAVEISGDEWGRYGWRDDTELPGLVAAADPDEVARRLEIVLGEPVECSVEPVRYRPGSRCVLRYDVEGASGRSTFYAKALQPDSYTRIAALHAEPAVQEDTSGLVAEMAAWWPDVHVIVWKAVEGRSASSLLADPDTTADDKVRLARDLGGLLAQFHDLDVPVGATWSADQQLISLADSMAAVERADPDMGIRLGSLVDVLATTAPAPGRLALGHGSFRAGQVVVTPSGQPVLLDVDEVRHSDRERDLGVALAHMTWQAARHPSQQKALALAEDALVAAYEEAAGELRPDALRWWRVSGLIQVAVRRFRRLEMSAWPLTDTLAAAAEDLVADSNRTIPADIDLLAVDQVSLALGRAAGHDVEVDSAELLGVAEGRRSVVRYEVRGLDGREETSGLVPVIGKQFVEARAARLSYYHLRLLADGPFTDGPLCVPSPLGLAGENRLLFYRADTGVPLDSLLHGTTAAEGVQSAAQWLARLHTSDLKLPRELSLAREVESTRQWAGLIAHEYPAATARAGLLASRWAAAAKSAAVDSVSPAVPIHKDFHAGHVFIGDLAPAGEGASTCVIDFDEARMGDAAFDVAHFCTYLEQLGAPHLVEWFIEAYSAASGWVDKGSLAPFRAYTCLKIAKQAAAGSGPFRDVPLDERLNIVDAALARGTSSVDTPWQGWS